MIILPVYVKTPTGECFLKQETEHTSTNPNIISGNGIQKRPSNENR